jgi:hypothetical protein
MHTNITRHMSKRNVTFVYYRLRDVSEKEKRIDSASAAMPSAKSSVLERSKKRSAVLLFNTGPVCVCVCVCVCLRERESERASERVSGGERERPLYVCMCIYDTHTYTCLHVCMYVHVHMYECMCVCSYTGYLKTWLLAPRTASSSTN